MTKPFKLVLTTLVSEHASKKAADAAMKTRAKKLRRAEKLVIVETTDD